MKSEHQPIAPLGLRMPPDIKAWVEAQAKKERMSMNSWLLRLIEKAQDAEKGNAPTAATVGASE